MGTEGGGATGTLTRSSPLDLIGTVVAEVVSQRGLGTADYAPFGIDECDGGFEAPFDGAQAGAEGVNHSWTCHCSIHAGGLP